eukprot:sb/3478855/
MENAYLEGCEPLVTQIPLHCGHAKTCLTFAMQQRGNFVTNLWEATNSNFSTKLITLLRHCHNGNIQFVIIFDLLLPSRWEGRPKGSVTGLRREPVEH